MENLNTFADVFGIKEIDEQNLIFKREGGGFNRLNKIFDDKLDQVLKHFNDSVWPQAQ